MIEAAFHRIILLTVCLLVLAGCTFAKPKGTEPYSVNVAYILSGKAILGHEVTDAELPHVDLFAVTPEMEAFARHAIRRSESYFDKVKGLHLALLSSTDPDGQGIAYSAYATEVPQVTFQQRRANCLSFTLLYVALARSVGIKAQVNEVQIPPTWDLRNKNEMVFLRHVNVKVPILVPSMAMLKRDEVIIDLEMNRYKSNYTQREISDVEAEAQFYSNRSMEYLENENFTDSFLSLRKSINLNNQQAYVWSNLGALYGRKNLWHEAEIAYLHALDLEPEDLTVRNNLAYLYNKTGDKEKAQKYYRLAQRYRESNPFFQYSVALSAYEHGDNDSALQYVLRAIAREKGDVRFYRLAADIYEKQGNNSKAEQMKNKIKKLAPK
jgi:tetratricopeptide (TPR) repeat protein